MQILMKHPALGNEHVEEKDRAEREAQGWVKWPRTKEQKGAAGGEDETSTEITRKDLEARAAAVDLKADRRWSVPRLAEEIRKAEALKG